MKECKEFTKYILSQLLNLLNWTIKKSLRLCLKIDRKIVKRYIGLETPLYKLWWKANCDSMQNKLNKAHEAWVFN